MDNLISTVQKAQDMKDEEKLYRYQGVLYPITLCPEEHLKALETLEARADDVLLVAYPKCGFNWMVGVLNKLVSEATGEKREKQGPPLIEFFGPAALKSLDQAPSPRILGTHLHPDNIPRDFFRKKTKMLVIFRNPKDTLVSYYHFSNNNPALPSQTWDSFYSDFMSGDVPWGSYFHHAQAWNNQMDDPNVLFVTYEELKKNLTEGIGQISHFFGFGLTAEQVQKVSEDSTFSAMKKNAASTHHTMASVIFRKGEVGDWKNHFSSEQKEKLDEVFEKELAGTRLGERLRFCE
ncbi:sulfotransferase 6B1 [Synchiropus splendidus]|uniref:sulfotransferase 6B1 n=1 Tax=Synchiropus splendidus TaxID=270530 RepID=UPI00237EBD88|nr:sulfotransferase 6B1 [Synchiropus splendidus]